MTPGSETSETTIDANVLPCDPPRLFVYQKQDRISNILI